MNAPELITDRATPLPLTASLLHTLGKTFGAMQAPQPVPQPHWVAVNTALADELGLTGWLGNPAALEMLAGNTAPTPGLLASVYSGHQFGVWAGQLGDGRALMLGAVDTAHGALELQLKGSGLTPYSRMGDGRAVLRSSIREFLCSEAMHHLGIPTTRALAIVGSPLPVRRESIETAAVVTRVAASFLRFGHFEHFTHTASDTDALRNLADATIKHHFPDCLAKPQPYTALLETVARRTARLLAQWQAVGFCHGVINTDNMSLLGLTIDYGPFGFLDAFDPGHICNHTDQQGRYAYARQPSVAFWNLHALAQALMPLIGDSDAALAALEPYKAEYASAMLSAWRAKLGLQTESDEDRALADDLLRLMAQDRADFTITFRRLATFGAADGIADGPAAGSADGTADASASSANPNSARDLFIDREAFDAWAQRYRRRLQAEGSNDLQRGARMNRVNPKVVLRNHLAEVAIERAREGDFSEVQRLLAVLQHPYDEDHPARISTDAGFPPDWAAKLEVSCSS